jgi:4-alpha-glucanotransferase
MDKLQLLMVIHSHQPVGTPDAVIQETVERSYLPFLEALERHPGVRIGLHYSGCLLEWMEENQPRFLDTLGKIVERGQVELLGGGFYEPLLSMVPEEDALGQLALMQEYLKRRFGTQAEGAWLTARIFEPRLASLLFRSSIRYTLLDESHFYNAGLEPKRLFGYWITEQATEAVAVFPIDGTLHRGIPFRPVPELQDELRSCLGPTSRSLVYGDDGEKFGSWPGTKEWVYDKGWLEEFFSSLEKSSDWLETLCPGSYLKRTPSNGTLYFPTSAYEELDPWNLSAETYDRFLRLKTKLQQDHVWGSAEPFIRGGSFHNLLSKYPEANQLHKKMLYVSRKLQEAMLTGEADKSTLDEARRLLYRGQCNSGYWHGQFGGVYLPALRDAIFRELIRAENILDRFAQGDEDWISFDQRDFDGDLEEELLVENALCNVYIDPGEGGVVTEIDYRPADFNLTNSFSRRAEGYHNRLREEMQGDKDKEGEPDGSRPEEGALHDLVPVDRNPRRSFMDRFPALHTTLRDLQRGQYVEEGDFLQSRYHVEKAWIDEAGDCSFEMTLTRSGRLQRERQEFPLLLEKTIKVLADQPELQVHYILKNNGQEPIDLRFCPEVNLNLLSGDDEKRRFEYEGLTRAGSRLQTMGETPPVSWVALVDGIQRFRVRLEMDPPTSVWIHPVETVSLSEEGSKRLFQGSALLPKWDLTVLPNKPIQVSLRLSCSPEDEDAEEQTSPDED